MKRYLPQSNPVSPVVIITVGVGLWAGASGCQQTCTSAESSYEQALAAEQTELADVDELSGDSPAQLGLALKTKVLGDIANIVVQPAIDAALNAASTIPIDGQPVDLTSRGDVVDFEISADSACDHCFELRTGLGGSIEADHPTFGHHSADLGGSLSLVAPLLLERGESSDAAVVLDLSALAEVGRSSLSARLGGVSEQLAGVLDGPVSDYLFGLLTEHLDPVTLVEFDAPSFGIPGFEVLPVQLVTDGASGTVFAGFATNIDALDVPGAPGVAPITDLGADENVALAFQPAIIGHSLSLLMDHGQVSRTYTSTGRADQDGAAHVTLDAFRVGPDVQPSSGGPAGVDAAGRPDAAVSMGSAATGDADVPFSLGFQVFNLSSQSSVCFGFGAEAIGGVSVRDHALQVDLIGVHFRDDYLQDSLIDLNSWTDADFIQRSHTLVTQSLDDSTVSVPGTDINVGPVGLGLRPNAVVLRGHSTMTPSGEAP